MRDTLTAARADSPITWATSPLLGSRFASRGRLGRPLSPSSSLSSSPPSYRRRLIFEGRGTRGDYPLCSTPSSDRARARPTTSNRRVVRAHGGGANRARHNRRRSGRLARVTPRKVAPSSSYKLDPLVAIFVQLTDSGVHADLCVPCDCELFTSRTYSRTLNKCPRCLSNCDGSIANVRSIVLTYFKKTAINLRTFVY